MSDETTSPKILHPFWDRSIRFLLQRPSHLRAIISLCHPELAERLETIDRWFILEDHTQREADLLVRVPYQTPAGPREVMVYVLLEHQSTVDPWMPLRLLFYMLQIWDDERKRVQSSAAGEPPRLSPIIPAVFYTGSRPWKASRDLQALIAGPAELTPFVPRFDILYMGLPEIDPVRLESVGPLGWALRAVQRVEADHPEFAAVLRRAAEKIEPLVRDVREEWRELIRFLVLLITHRRPEEVEDLQNVLRTAMANQDAQTELTVMSKSMAEVWMEEGIEKGIKQGIERGREEGRLESCREMILRIGRRRLGEPSPVQLARIEHMTDLAALKALSDAIIDATSWDAVLSER